MKNCHFCELLKNPAEDSTFIAEFEHSVAYLNYQQKEYKGQSILILKEHHDHLHLVPQKLQNAVSAEMTLLTQAVLKAFAGFRANHQSLGNQVSHVHWHIVPRYHDDHNKGYAPQNIDTEKLSDQEYEALALQIRKWL